MLYSYALPCRPSLADLPTETTLDATYPSKYCYLRFPISKVKYSSDTVVIAITISFIQRAFSYVISWHSSMVSPICLFRKSLSSSILVRNHMIISAKSLSSSILFRNRMIMSAKVSINTVAWLPQFRCQSKRFFQAILCAILVRTC